MKNNLSIMNYDISSSDLKLSLYTGFSGAPYAERHWEAAKQSTSMIGVWGHRCIAVIEFVPLLGGLVALIEGIVACLFADCCILDNEKDAQYNLALSTNHSSSVTKINNFTMPPRYIPDSSGGFGITKSKGGIKSDTQINLEEVTSHLNDVVTDGGCITSTDGTVTVEQEIYFN